MRRGLRAYEVAGMMQNDGRDRETPTNQHGLNETKRNETTPPRLPKTLNDHNISSHQQKKLALTVLGSIQ